MVSLFIVGVLKAIYITVMRRSCHTASIHLCGMLFEDDLFRLSPRKTQRDSHDGLIVIMHSQRERDSRIFADTYVDFTGTG